MSHVASDLSYEVSQKRRRELQLFTPQLNERFGVTHLLVQRPVVREAVPSDREVGVDEATWAALRLTRRLER